MKSFLYFFPLFFIFACSLAADTPQGDRPFCLITGIKCTTTPGKKPSEQKYFYEMLFVNKPSSYFYQVKLKEKKIIFEFHDTKKAASIDSIVLHPPLTGYFMEELKIDVNRGMKNAAPSWQNVVKLTLTASQVPQFRVTDENNIIGMVFAWPSDTSAIKDYIVHENYTDGWPHLVSKIIQWTVIVGLTVWFVSRAQ